MFRIISQNKLLFILYFLGFFSCLAFLLYFGKKETHLLLTSCHSTFTDLLMKLFTLFGDGSFMVIAGIALLFKRIRYGLVILSSFLVSSLLAQALKRLVFEDCMRPVAWFHEMGIEIYRVSGVEYHSAFSFPSGHTTTAFALFFGLAFLDSSKSHKIIFLIIAAITGFSRVYLSQHFLGDILAGSVLGIATAIFIQWLFEKINPEWMDKDLVSVIRKKNA